VEGWRARQQAALDTLATTAQAAPFLRQCLFHTVIFRMDPTLPPFLTQLIRFCYLFSSTKDGDTRMRFEPTDIEDVVLIRPDVFGDARGHFFEYWQARKFTAGGLQLEFCQDNQNLSARHVLRGLHYQLRKPQGKLVRVVTGAVLDVAVDLRRSSRTFGKWVSAELNEENHHMLWVPPGFGHGFVVLSESTHFLYKCTELYAPEDERVIAWDDPELHIDWRLPAGVRPILSARDAAAQSFAKAPHYL
jgi:dTDP-4-dehydrorhamnose 3,5-epimerase